jgi:hypothetical protein
MNEPLRNAKVGTSMLAAYGYAPIQWKIALARMQEANMAAVSSLVPRSVRSPNITWTGTLK